MAEYTFTQHKGKREGIGKVESFGPDHITIEIKRYRLWDLLQNIVSFLRHNGKEEFFTLDLIGTLDNDE